MVKCVVLSHICQWRDCLCVLVNTVDEELRRVSGLGGVVPGNAGVVAGVLRPQHIELQRAGEGAQLADDHVGRVEVGHVLAIVLPLDFQRQVAFGHETLDAGAVADVQVSLEIERSYLGRH